MQVTANTSVSKIFFVMSELTAKMDTPDITSKLKAAEPTMDMGPRELGTASKSRATPLVASMISGADEPRAISVKFATVGFQNSFSTMIKCPYESGMTTTSLLDVMTSIDSMKISATIAIPRKNQKSTSR